MSSYVSAYHGYGIWVPEIDDIELDGLTPQARELVEEFNLDEYELYEQVLNLLGNKRLTFLRQHHYTYSEGTLILLKSTVQGGLGGITVLAEIEEFDPRDPDLIAVANFFNIEFDPSWFVVANYG